MLRGPQGRTYTPSAEGASASLWWSLTGLFAMQTKNVGADEKNEAAADLNTWCCPLKDFTEIHLNGSRACLFLLAYLDRYPCQSTCYAGAAQVDNSLRSGCFSSNRPCHRGTVRSPDMAANGEATAVPDDVFPAGVKNPTALGKKSNPRSACVAG